MWIKAKWHSVLAEVAEKIEKVHTVEQAGDVIVDGGLCLGFERARLWLADDQIGGFLLGVSQAGNQSLSEIVGFTMPLVGLDWDPWARAPQVVQAAAEVEDYFAELHLKAPVDDWVVIPLWDGKRFLGVLELDYGDRSYKTPSLRDALLHLLQRHVVIAIKHAQQCEQGQFAHSDFEEPRAKEQHQSDELGLMHLLNEITEDLQHALTTRALGRIALAGAQRLGFKRGRFYRLSADGKSLECIAQVGSLTSMVGFRIQLESAVYANDILKEFDPQFLDGRDERQALLDHRFILDFKPPVGTWVCMPLWGHRECFGMLALDNAEDPRSLISEQRDVIRLFQGHVGAALERTCWYEQQRLQRFQQIWVHKLNQVIEETQQARTVQQVADTIVDRMRWLGFRRARLWRLMEDGETLVGVSQTGSSSLEPFTDIQLKLTDIPISSRALKETEILICSPRDSNFGILEVKYAFEPSVGPWIALPLYIYKESPWGILILDDVHDERLVWSEQIALLELFRYEITLSLEQVQLPHDERVLTVREEVELLKQIADAAHNVLKATSVILYPLDKYIP